MRLITSQHNTNASWQNFFAERLKIKRFYFFNKKIITQANQKIRDAANACIFHAPCVNL